MERSGEKWGEVEKWRGEKGQGRDPVTQTLRPFRPPKIKMQRSPSNSPKQEAKKIKISPSENDNFDYFWFPNLENYSTGSEQSGLGVMPMSEHSMREESDRKEKLGEEETKKPETMQKEMKRKTGLIYDSRCLHHLDLFSNVEKEGHHPERALRIKTAMQVLQREGISDRCIRLPVIELDSIQGKQLLANTHGMHHVERMEMIPTLQKDALKDFSRSYNSVYFSQPSYNAALVAAGGVVAACRAVMSGVVDNALAIVRPPGHHAEKHEAMGFCLFNNIGVAISDVKKEYHGKGRGEAGALKILVVDWDVHHGNGIQQLFVDDPHVLYISLHRYDAKSFYPNFASAGAYFTGVGKGRGYTVNIPWQTEGRGGVGDVEYMHAFDRIVMPIAREFDPDLVIVAAGFDAARGDPIGGCDLTPRGYAQMTHMLSGLAGGRCVVALEGGYNPTSVALSLAACASILLGDLVPRLAGGVRSSPPANHAFEVVELVRRIQCRYWACLLPRAGIESDLVLQASDWNWAHLAHDFHAMGKEEARDQKRRYLSMMSRMNFPISVSGTVLEQIKGSDDVDPLRFETSAGAVDDLYDTFSGSTTPITDLISLQRSTTMRGLGFAEFEVHALLSDIIGARFHGSVFFRDPFSLWKDSVGPSGFVSPKNVDSVFVLVVVHESGIVRGDSRLYDSVLISSTSQLFDPSVPFLRDLMRVGDVCVLDVCIDYETMASRSVGLSPAQLKETVEEGIGAPLWDVFLAPLLNREGSPRVSGVGFVGVGQGSELVSWWACHCPMEKLSKRQAVLLIPPPSHGVHALPRVVDKADWWKDVSCVVVAPHPNTLWTEIECNLPEFGGLVSGGGVQGEEGVRDYFFGYEPLQPPLPLELSCDSWTLFSRLRRRIIRWFIRRLKISKERRASGWQEEETDQFQNRLEELESRSMLARQRIEPILKNVESESDVGEFPVSGRRYTGTVPVGSMDDSVDQEIAVAWSFE